MHSKGIKLGLAALAATMVSAESDVQVLKSDTFKDYIAKNELVMAEFYAPWCGHCKALAPEYEQAATALKEKNIKLAKIDCTEETEICSEYNVEGYPTIKIFVDHDAENPLAYKNQRKAADIQEHLIKLSMPAVSILTKDTVEAFKESSKVVLVAYYDEKDTTTAETILAAAGKLRENFSFGASTDAELIAAEGVKLPALVLYKTFDEGKAIFDGETLDFESISNFAKIASTPLIGEIGPETYGEYMNAGIPLAYIFAESAEERESYTKAFKSIAEKHRGKINFGVIDATMFGAHAGNLNLKTDQFPAFVVHDIVKNKKFPFDQEKELAAADIEAFVDGVVDGTVEPSIKSEEIPETQDGPVTVVVAKNYDQVVLDDTKDVLIEFYAPWCGHCKALAPKYDELGGLFAKSEFKDKVVISKVDATANDVPDEISGFPTIKLYPAGDKTNAVTYSGDRSIEDLIKFIKENGKHNASVSLDSAKDAAAEDADEEAEPAASEEAKEEDHDEL